MTLKLIPHRPQLSDLLILASADKRFQLRLLASPKGALEGMGATLPPEDRQILESIPGAQTLAELAYLVEARLTNSR
jgi:hypothetical protein